LVLAIAALSFGERLFAFDGSERTLTRVRGADPEIHRLILEGDRRSPTFRKLVDEIQQSNAVVLIGFGLCRRDQFRSCVSHVAGDERQRHIRILVNTRTTSDRLVATIAHELQHAVEIISEPNVRDVESVSALYRRIGTGKCRQGLSEICETDAARLIEKQVAQELDDEGEHR
jgi:hypothetical protein